MYLHGKWRWWRWHPNPGGIRNCSLHKINWTLQSYDMWNCAIQRHAVGMTYISDINNRNTNIARFLDPRTKIVDQRHPLTPGLLDSGRCRCWDVRWSSCSMSSINKYEEQKYHKNKFSSSTDKWWILFAQFDLPDAITSHCRWLKHWFVKVGWNIES